MMSGVYWKQLILTVNIFKANLSPIRTFSILEEGSAALSSQFRDYLWFNSSTLIRGYDFLGVNELSIFIQTSLLSHLCWATSMMFLISWRGYWQEIIDTICLMQQKTQLLADLQFMVNYPPTALSIVQARFIGLCHFVSGLILTYIVFLLGSAN